MNKIYSILLDIFAASLFILSMWLIGRSDETWIGIIVFAAAMVLLYKGDSLWNSKPQPKTKTKK
jgi:predicted membrane channel-forming protein YqfA (hemolysin III family)